MKKETDHNNVDKELRELKAKVNKERIEYERKSQNQAKKDSLNNLKVEMKEVHVQTNHIMTLATQRDETVLLDNCR